jgi:hypothetical protein
MPRALNADERSVLDFLLTREFPGRDELVVQARSVQTTGLSCTCGCPSFSLKPDLSLPPAPVTDPRPTDAHGIDPAGTEIGVLLFVDDGYLSDVEIYNFDDRGFAGLPDPAALKLSEWSERDESGSRHLLNP